MGRDREQAALVGLLEAIESAGGVAGIIGAAGMGKSRLLDAVEAVAEERGLTTARVGCAEHDQNLPLSAAAALADALGADAADGPDGLASLALDQAVGVPLVYLVDDAQWFDAASVPFAISLVHAAGEGRIVLVVAARPPGPTSNALHRILGTIERRGAPVVHLDSLADDDAVRLAEDVLGRALDDDDRTVLAAAAGNPYLVLEVANALSAGHRPGAESVLSHTMHNLTPGARTLLEHASVLGRTASVFDLARMAQVPATSLSDAVREACAAGLVDATGETLVFRHDLIREAVYASLPTAVRGAVHRQAADALEARGAPALEFSTHLVEGALPGDPAAIRALQRASAAARSADLGVATGLLEAARRLCDDRSEDAEAIDRRLVTLYAWTGRSRDAVALADRLLERALEPDDEARLRAGLAEALARGGDERAGAREAERTLALEGLSDSRRATLLLLVATGLWQSEPARCREVLAEAWALVGPDSALEVPIIEHQAVTYSSDADLGSFVEWTDRGVRAAREALAAGRPLAEAHLQWALCNAGEAAISVERYDQALRLLTESEHRARRAGLGEVAVPDIVGLRAEAHLVWCRWSDALAEIHAREEMLLESGRPDTSASGLPIRTASMRTRVGILTGEPVDPMMEKWLAVIDTPIERARYEWWAGLRAELAGERETAVAHFVVGADVLRSFAAEGKCAVRTLGWQLSWATPYLVLETEGRHDEATAIADAFASVAAANAWLPRWASWSASVRAARERSIDELERAVEHAGAVASPMFRHQALVDAAMAAEHLDATTTADRVRVAAAELAADFSLATPPPGGRGAKRAAVRRRAARPVFGWESLTPTEVRVAELVADGLSNAAVAGELLISRYTVETHLKHIFQKLGVRSRVELATFVVRRG